MVAGFVAVVVGGVEVCVAELVAVFEVDAVVVAFGVVVVAAGGVGVAAVELLATLATAAFCASTPSVRKVLNCGPANTTAGV
ncbi:MAG: hypothetical protein ACRDAM_01810 [Casimicrobium sp.]